MQLETKALKDVLKRAKGFIGSNNALSILSYVRLCRNVMYATDLTKEFIADLPEDIGFDVCVNYQDFSSLIDGTKFESVDLELEDDKLKIECGDYCASIATASPDTFPEMESPELKDMKPIPSDFRVAVSHVIGYVSTDETRAFMCGVFVKGREVVATDGRRLGMYTMDKSGEEFPEMIIPTAFISQYMGIDVDNFMVDEKRIWLHGPDGLIGGHLIDGQYPNYKRVFPDKKTVVHSFPFEQAFLSGSSVVKVLMKKGDQGVNIKILPREFQIVSAVDKGNILYRCPIGADAFEDPDTHEKTPGYEYPEVEFWINYQCLMESIKEEVVQMSLYPKLDSDTISSVEVVVGSYRSLVACIERERIDS